MNQQQASPAPEFASSEDAPAQAEAERARGRSDTAWFKRKRFILPSALTVLLVIILAVSGGFDSAIFSAFTSDPQPAATKTATTVAGIGSKAVDGKLAFVVTGVERPGKTMPGKNHTTLTAKGEFVIVRVNVTNMGAAARSIDLQPQALFNDKGMKYSPATAILSTKDALKFVQLIEPGATVTGADMLFDVAPGTRPASIELHDSGRSHGVRVTLS